MAIIRCPAGTTQHSATCVVCKLEQPLSVMSAGMRDAQHRQAFACDHHFWNKNEYVVGWVDFSAAEHWALVAETELAWAGEYHE